MARQNPIYYISPGNISITPNANGSANDLSVYLQRGTKIKVYVKDCPGLEHEDSDYKQWQLQGRNRRLNGGNGPYTIYARLNAEDTTDGYLVFAAKTQIPGGWADKYQPVTESTRQPLNGYWWIKLGTVSEVESGKRTIDLDTGILGTQQYNDSWQLEPENLPYRVVINNSLEADPPYVKWDTGITLHASLVQGWGDDASDKVSYWTIERSTGNTSADSAWNNNHRTAVSSEGIITLQHNKNAVDDFNKAVAAVFTLKAWGEDTSEDSSSSGSSSSGSSEEPEIVPIASESITILAETVAKYALELSSANVHYSPTDDTYTPSAGINIRVKATAEDGTLSVMDQTAIQNANLNLYYDQIDAQHRLTFVNGTANLSVSVFQTLKRSVNLYLTENSTEVNRATVSFTSDGQDGTGVQIKGTVDVVFNANKETPQQTSLEELEGLTGVSVGDCWVVDANRHLYSFNGTSALTEETPAGWTDLGVFKGEKGDPGPAGESVWIADCDNEMDSVATNGVGMVKTQQDVQTKLSLYYGKTSMNFSVVSVQRNDETPITVSGAGANFVNFYWNQDTEAIQNKPGVLLIRYAGGASFSSPAREKDVFTVILRSTDEPTIQRTLTVTVPWTEGVIYNINPSVSQVNIGRTDSGGYDPSEYNLTCGYKRRNEDGSVYTSTNFTGIIDSTWRIYFRRHHRPTAQQTSGYWETYYHRYGNSQYRIYVTSLAVATWDAVEFILCSSSGDELESLSGIKDRETVPVVADGTKGKQGEQGEQGDDGVSPYVATLSTENVMLHTTGNNKPTKAQTITVVARLMKGEDEVTPSITAVKRNGSAMTKSGNNWTATGLTVSYNSSTHVITLSYTTAASLQSGKDKFTFTIAHVQDGTTRFSDDKVLEVNAYAQDQYSLLPSEDQIIVDRIGTTYSPDQFTLYCGYRKIDVDAQVTKVDRVMERIDGLYNLYFRRHLRSAGVWENYYYLYYFYAEGQDDSSTGDDSDEGEHMLTNVSVSDYDGVEFILCKNTDHRIAASAVTGLLYEASVPVMTNGRTGATGPSYYYMGEWLDQGTLPDSPNPDYIPNGTEIRTTQYERPFISYTVQGQDPLYYLYIGTGAITADSNRYDPQSRLDLWEPMQSQNKYIIANAVFAKFAQFGSAVINQDWLISSNGRIDGVEFAGGKQITGKKVNASSSGWMAQAYTLFDNRNPKATSQSLLYKKNQNLDKLDSDHNREIGRLFSLSADATYSVRVWGRALNGNANIYIKVSRSGVGTTDVLEFDDFVSASHNMQAFFRVEEDGDYMIDIVETGPSYYGAIVDFIEVSQVAFAPIYAVDLMTGGSIQRDMMTSGFIRKDKTTVNQLNFTDYTKGLQDGRLNLNLCGSFIEVKDDLLVQLWPPLLCKNSDLSGLPAYVDEKKDDVRSLVGTKLLFYLTEGVLNYDLDVSYGWWIVRDGNQNVLYTVKRHLVIDGTAIQDPESGSDSYKVSNTFLYRVTSRPVGEDNDGKPIYDFTWEFQTLTSGQFAELECMTDVDNSGHEVVYWRVNKLGNIS